MALSRTTGSEEARWAACFRGPNNEPYLLVREFKSGMESSVQLLIHRHNERLIVRKVPHRMDTKRLTPDLVTAAHIAAFGDRNEIQMVKYLAPFAKRNPTPYIYQLIESRSTEVAPSRSGKFLRESFWEHYNVGSLDDLAQLYQNRLTYPPASLVARIIHQVLSSLQFILSSGRGVRHRDLHFGNILVQWNNTDFLPNVVIADFGDAEFVGEDASSSSSSDRARIKRGMVIVDDASMFAGFLVSSWFFPARLARDARFAALVRALEQLRLRDLSTVIREARSLENACIDEEGEDNVIAYFEVFEAQQKREPCVAKTWTSRALAQHGTQGLPGPFELIRF